MKTTISKALLAFGLTSTLGFSQTDPGVTAGRVTPTTPTAPAADTAEKTAPEASDSRPGSTPGSITQSAPKTAAATPAKKDAEFAKASLQAKSGSKAAGTVSFVKEADGIRLTANVTGVTAGKHGIHIHEKGDCSAPDASSAGGHFNPGSAPHGDPKATARHAGDFGNIDIDKNGSGTLKLKVSNPKDFTAWNDIGGKAIIIHEKADDLKTQPTGDAGARIACGVIELTPTTSH